MRQNCVLIMVNHPVSSRLVSKSAEPRQIAVSVMLAGAVEKQKLVYILNRDAQARLTISSPLEAHKSNTLVYHMVGVDVGFENPTFACLEIDYEVCSFSQPFDAHCCYMGTAIKHPVTDCHL